MSEKKRCVICGCNLYPNSEFDICDCCLDDIYERESTREEVYRGI